MQALLKLDNGGGAFCDVSYLEPDSFRYATPAYWRFVIHGSGGYLELSAMLKKVLVFKDGEKEVREVPLDEGRPGGYFEDFLLDFGGQPDLNGLHSAGVLAASRVTLLAQKAADQGVPPKRLRHPSADRRQIPPCTILAMRAAKGLLQTVPGEVLGPGSMLLTSFSILGPLCIFSGALFTAGSKVYAMAATASIGESTGSVYLWEAVGPWTNSPGPIRDFVCEAGSWFTQYAVPTDRTAKRSG